MTPETPDRKDIQRFQSAVDHRLSGLREDPFLAKRIIANETGEKKVKKRMSLGLVLALTVIMAATAVLAENWPGISDYLANGLPDRVTQPSGAESEDGKAEGTVIQRHVIEPVYAPVRVHVVNDAGEEICAFDLTPQVAQVEYHYTMLYRTDKTWALEPDIVIAAAGQQDLTQAMRPFEPYLFISGKLDSGSCDFSVYQWDVYKLDFTKYRGTVSYIKELYLNEQGEIVRTVQDEMAIRLGLVDDNGTLPENCFEAATQTIPYLSFPDSEETTLSALSTALVPAPTSAPSRGTEITALPSPESAAMNYGQLRGEYSNNVRFGLPFILHCVDQDDNTAVESRIDSCVNMYAVLDPGEHINISEIGGKHGAVETEYGILILSGYQPDVDIIFQKIEEPEVTAIFEDGGYTVRIAGGEFRVQYPTDVYYDQEVQLYDDSSWYFMPVSDHFLYAEYAEGEYPYDFTFRLEELPERGEETKQTEEEKPAGLQFGGVQDAEYYDTLLFGAPYTLHYTDENGTLQEVLNDNCTNMTAHFNRQQFELLEDFGKQDGPVETEYELLLLGTTSTSDGGVMSFQEVEKPDVTVYYQKDFYTVRFSGGKFRLQYPTDLYYSQEAYHQIDSITWEFDPSRAYLTHADYAVEEYPYDFTFRLMNPLDFHTVETFGSELPPITHRYIGADGTEKEWEFQTDHFEASLQEQAVTRLVDLSQEEQTLEYQDSFISIRSNTIPVLPQVTVLEKPECVVTPLSNGYEMRVTGGMMRMRYLSVIWRQESADGTIMTLDAPDGREAYTTVEIPFDFTFTVPVYK
ncbi:MAG: hypothetical protein IKN04_12680 [Clostridia bacterium]|nr:hypothetical protein [Clostridia bacterium]